MPNTKSELLQGTLDLLILKTLRAEPRHGYAIAQRIQRHSDDVLVVEEGSLYPALYRMEEKGYLRSCEQTAAGKSRRCYTATTRGRRALKQAKARVRELFDEIFEDEMPPTAR